MKTIGNEFRSKIKKGVAETKAAGIKPLSEQKCITARNRKKEPEKLPEIIKDEKLSMQTKIERKRTLFRLNRSFKSHIEQKVVRVIRSMKRSIRKSIIAKIRAIKL